MSQMLNCVQCGRTFSFPEGGSNASSPASPIWCCSGGCVDAYHRQHGLGKYNPIPTAVLGLAGKAIGGAISSAKARKQEQAQQEAEDRERREEEDREYEEKKASASAARHVITHEVVCPICDADVTAKMASDGETKVRCKKCKTRLKVEHDGDVTVLGPKDKPLSGAESTEIKEDRLCSQCKWFLKDGKIYWKKWLILMGIVLLVSAVGWVSGGLLTKIGMVVITILALIIGFFNFIQVFDRCGNKDAVSAAGDDRPCWINANQRCKFWEKA